MAYPITDCKEAEAKYIGPNKKSNFKEWQIDAFNEEIINGALKAKKKKTHYTDKYQCFCKYQNKKKIPKNKVYSYKK